MLRTKYKFEQEDKVSYTRQVFISIATGYGSKVLTQSDDTLAFCPLDGIICIK